MLRGFDHALIEAVNERVVGREEQVELLVAALACGRHLLLEGPPGVGKTTLLRSIAHARGTAFEFVEGNAELTPSRLIGSFDPARVLADGYQPDVFLDGPLVRALRDGALLYIEEINRVPEETLNVLITVMSEREITVPRLGTVVGDPNFRLVAAMNPTDSVGTARISGAVYDRCCRVAVDYQDAAAEAEIVQRAVVPTGEAATGTTAVSKTAGSDAASHPGNGDGFSPAIGDRTQIGAGGVHSPGKLAGPGLIRATVEMVRATRDHPDLRSGSSVRGAIDLVAIAAQLAALRDTRTWSNEVTLPAARAAPGRVRVREGSGKTPESVIDELWEQFLRRDPGDDADEPADDASGEDSDDAESPGPGGGSDGDLGGANPNPNDRVLEGKEAEDAIANASRKTTSRRDLSRHNRFDEVSPEVGVLDEGAFDEVFDDNPDEALSMLADLVGATDERLRILAQRLAAQVVIAAGSAAQRSERGIGRLVSRPLSKATGDLDLDGSLDAIVELSTGSDPHAADHLRVHAWRRPQIALCLLIDRSGSMHGDRLATAAVAASAVLFRSNAPAAVAAFAQDTIVLTSGRVLRTPDTVVTNLLRLRGHGVTDLATALAAAADLLADSNAARRVTVLLSDCRVTEGGHGLSEAANLDELVILAPADDTADAEAFAQKVGAKWAPVASPMDVPTALAQVLG